MSLTNEVNSSFFKIMLYPFSSEFNNNLLLRTNLLVFVVISLYFVSAPGFEPGV